MARARDGVDHSPGIGSTVRRLPFLLLLSISGAAVTIWDEVLLAGPIVFLTETLGFALGFLAFAFIWAAIGIGALVAIDYIWPALSPRIDHLTRRFVGHPRRDSSAGSQSWAVPIRVAIAVLGLTGAAAAALLVGEVIVRWSRDHYAEIAMFVAVALVIFVILATVDWIGRGLERWIRRAGTAAGPKVRFSAALATMIFLGPVGGWGLFPFLGFTRKATYGLTLLAAPVFAIIWVPFYTFGIWGLLQESL